MVPWECLDYVLGRDCMYVWAVADRERGHQDADQGAERVSWSPKAVGSEGVAWRGWEGSQVGTVQGPL